MRFCSLFPACLILLMGQMVSAAVCVDFESLTGGTVYPVGSSFSENTVTMTIQPGIDTSGQPVPGGFAQIIQFPQGSGNQALFLSNATVCLDLGCGDNLQLTYGNSGGYVNLFIDGDKLEVATLSDGTFILGGTEVTVSGGTISVSVLTSGIGEICIGGQELIVDNICFEPCDNTDCLEFEGITKELASGDGFTEDGLLVEVTGFDGNSGFLSPGTGNLAGHIGQELDLKNAGISLNDICASGISFQFGELDQGVEICINGDCVTTDSFTDLDGLMLGGATISVSGKLVGDVLTGTVSISGTIDSFQVGGRSLRLDHVCRQACERNCIDFEKEAVRTKFTPGDVFSEDGYEFGFDQFQSGDASGTIDDQGRAGHLGQDMRLENALFFGRFTCMDAFSVHYGQYTQGVRVTINGDSVNAASMDELDGQVIGGVTLSVTFDLVNGGQRGVLQGVGRFDELVIGGTLIYIDHLCLVPCPDPDCVDFEVFPLNAQYRETDFLMEDSTEMQVTGFGPGTALATIVDGNSADHIGNEIRLQQAGLSIRYPCASAISFHYAIDNGPVVLSVNGVNGPQVSKFSSYDGTVIGDANISVTGTDKGTVTITGTLLQVVIAGTDLHIDHICHVPCSGNCLDFEGIHPGESWFTFQGFIEDDVQVRTYLLFDLSGDLVDPDPVMRTSTSQRAGHLGQEIRLTNATAEFQFDDPCVTNLSLHFGNYGDLVNLQIGGDLVRAADMAALDGQVIGGVTVSVIRFPVTGGYTGLLRLDGNIDSLYIGGTNFYIDRVCFDVCEPIALGQLRILNVEDLSPTQRRYTLETEMTGPGILRLRANNDLGPTRPVQTGAVISPLASPPDTYRIQVVKPPSTLPWFFWAEAVYFE
jgi:hypothetical protein